MGRYFAVFGGEMLNCKRKKPISNKGFTLCELIIAMGVTAVILTATVTLAYALSSATRSSDQLMRSDTVLRSSSLRISEMIKLSNLAVTTVRGGVALWTDENTDGAIDSDEISYIEPSDDGSSLEILKYPVVGQNMSINQVQTTTNRTLYATLISDCSNITFTINAPLLVMISFDMDQDGTSRNHQITAAVRCSDNGILGGG
jgi:prepilin-type N-terminal cleavage/methylation domain-containing protein